MDILNGRTTATVTEYSEQEQIKRRTEISTPRRRRHPAPNIDYYRRSSPILRPRKFVVPKLS